MAIDRNDSEERQARLDWMMEDFRTAQQRRTVKAASAFRNRREPAGASACATPAPRDNAH